MKQRPKPWLRRAIFQLHLWSGIATGLLLTVFCLSGSVLVFRPELQRRAFPELLASNHQGSLTDITKVLAAVQSAYPGQQVTGVDAPTVYRQTYLAYVMVEDRFKTVLADPRTGKVLGELPESSWVASLQELHFNLLLGRTGATLNQIAAAASLLLALTGAVIWWQGRHWRRGLRIRGGPWPGVLRNLHGATGAWCWIVLLVIATTACSLSYPRQFRALVSTVFPEQASLRAPSRSLEVAALNAAEVIRRAKEQFPHEHISRVVLPARGAAIYQINFASQQPTALAPSSQRTRRFDASTGRLVEADADPTLSTLAIEWSAALHVGNFAGNAVRVLWALLGLIPPLLFGTGALLWWRRVVRPSRSDP